VGGAPVLRPGGGSLGPGAIAVQAVPRSTSGVIVTLVELVVLVPFVALVALLAVVVAFATDTGPGAASPRPHQAPGRKRSCGELGEPGIGETLRKPSAPSHSAAADILSGELFHPVSVDAGPPPPPVALDAFVRLEGP